MQNRTLFEQPFLKTMMFNSSNHYRSDSMTDTPVFIAYSVFKRKAFLIRLTSEAKIMLDPKGT